MPLLLLYFIHAQLKQAIVVKSSTPLSASLNVSCSVSDFNQLRENNLLEVPLSNLIHIWLLRSLFFLFVPWLSNLPQLLVNMLGTCCLESVWTIMCVKLDLETYLSPLYAESYDLLTQSLATNKTPAGKDTVSQNT